MTHKIYLLFLIVITSFFYSCGNEEVASGTCYNNEFPLNILITNNIGFDMDTFIVNNYINDAKALYFREIMNNENHPNYNDPIFNHKEIQKILIMLQCIYNLQIPESDSIFNIYNIHAPRYSYDYIYIKVEPEASTMKAFSKGIFPTGDDKFDKFLLKYEFRFSNEIYDYPNYPWLSMSSKKEYNLFPIMKELEELPYILITEGSFLTLGDGSNIQLQQENDSAIITFYKGFGDCPAGCTYKEYHEFSVKNNKATFIKKYSKGNPSDKR